MSINVNDKENTSIYFTSPLFLPCTIEDPNFLGVYSSTSTLPTAPNNFNTAGVAGTGSMYVYLNSTWQYIGQYLYDAYRYLVYYQGSVFASASGTKWQSVLNDIASTSTLMTEFAGNSTAMTNLANSSIAMNVITSSYIAMNAMTTLVAYNAFISASAGLSAIQQLVSNINLGNIVLGGGTTGSSSALGLNALLVLLSYNNATAVNIPSDTSNSPIPTLAQKIYGSYTMSTFVSGTSGASAQFTLQPNQIVFVVAALGTGSYANVGSGTGFISGANNLISGAANVGTSSTPLTFVNGPLSPFFLGNNSNANNFWLTGASNSTATAYYVTYITYTPS